MFSGRSIPSYRSMGDMAILIQVETRSRTRKFRLQIRRFDPQILLVGMGMPLQEIWIRENLDRIQANAVFCCGALMDYIAGASLAPPRWLGPIRSRVALSDDHRTAAAVAALLGGALVRDEGPGERIGQPIVCRVRESIGRTQCLLTTAR